MIKSEAEKAANEADEAASHIHSVDFEGALGQITKALPDSKSAPAAKAAAATLERDRDAWVAKARAHVGQTKAAVAGLHATDDAAATAAHTQITALGSAPGLNTPTAIAQRLGGLG